MKRIMKLYDSVWINVISGVGFAAALSCYLSGLF